jgi:hypothetical protein
MRRILQRQDRPPLPLRVATHNVHGLTSPQKVNNLLRSWAACPPAQHPHILCLQETWLDMSDHPSQHEATAWIHSACTDPALAGWNWHHPRAYLPATCRMGEPTMQVLPSYSCELYPSCPSTWTPSFFSGTLRCTPQRPPAARYRRLGRSPTLPCQHLLANRTRCPAELQGPGAPPTPAPLPPTLAPLPPSQPAACR